MPPVLPSVVVTLPGPHTDVTVAQQGPVPSAPSSDVQVAAMGVLPRTGVTPGVVVGLAWTAVVAGAALLAIRAVPRLPVRLARIRTGRRGRGNGDRASR